MKIYVLTLFLSVFSLFVSQAKEANPIILDEGLSEVEISEENIGDITKQTTFYDLTKSLPRGYVRDGTVDYTRFLQKGINKYSNVSFPNFPILINDSGLQLRSNTKLRFSSKSKLILKPTNKQKYEMLRIHQIENVEIQSPVLDGNRKKHLGKKGEWGAGISIYSSRNISIYNAKIDNCWGDGITISKTANGAVPNLINIYDANISNCRRNGISIIAARNLKIIRPIISDIHGTAPGAGIDIEPANQSYQLHNIIIESPATSNSVYGILLALERASGSKSQPITININNHIDNNSTIGFRVAKFRPVYRQNKPLQGKITITNPKWEKSKKQNLLIEDTFDLTPHIYFKGNGFEVGKNNSRRVSQDRN